jgi:hypothetical protein
MAETPLYACVELHSNTLISDNYIDRDDNYIDRVFAVDCW